MIKRWFRNNLATSMIIALCFGVYAMQIVAPRMILNYGNIPAMIYVGEYHRLLTAGFLHASFTHLTGNMLMLHILGGFLESRGKTKYITIFLISIIGASLLSFAYFSLLGQFNAISVGASGGIFGLMGALLVVYRRNRKNPAYKLVGLWLIRMLVINVVIGITSPGIDMAAHLGGFATGTLLAVIMEDKPRKS